MADVRLADASPRFSTAHLALEAFCGSCTKDGDCSSNVCRTWADEGFGGIGYCTVTCDSDNPCGAGQGLCVDGTCKVQQVRRCKDGDLWRGDACGNDFEKLETCAPDHPCVAFGTVARCPAISGGQCETCEADEHCKDGYTCEAWTEEPDARWCAKACTTDSDCVFGMSCDAASQTCRPEWKDECSAGERSLKDTCGRELGLPPDCSEGNPCPCDGATDPACKACTTDADCYKGYVCEARSDNATVKWCARACRTDSDCPIGQACNAQAGSGRCVPEVGLGCHGGDAARVDACGNLVEVVQDCTDDQACVEGRCRDGGACAACDEDGDCVGGRVCRSSAVNGDVSFCAKTCTVDGDCDAGYSCDTSDPADKHCVPDDSTVCQAKEVWRQDTCDNMLIKTQDCGTVCVDGACTDADGLCALCNPDLGNADCLADHVCAELSGTGGVNACLPLCGGVHPECPAGTACEGDPARCVPGTRTECTDAGLLKTLDTCGNVINEGQSCGDGEKCLDDQCLTCSCSAGDCCSDGCRPDSVGTVCGDCLVCNASAQCVTAQDGNDPGDRCGADACLGGGCTGTVCGNGTKETGESCDDGNNVSGDGCAGDCSAVEPYCGNGTVDTLEDCDDGNEVGGDGCDTDCTWSCVNPANDCAQMDEDCQKPVCTDVFSQGSKVGQRCGVAADAQDAPVATDTCITTTCEDTTPKNAVMADGNECTVSGEGGDHWCIDGACTLNECGDGYKGDGEECDDGQANNDDVANACRSTCVLPACGDGIVDSGESCDDGGDGDATDGCMDNCEFSCTSDAECGNVVGDCETVTCKANDVGQACTAGVDTKDIKDDDNPCTTDLCIDGEPKNQVDPALEGDSCDPGEPGDGWCISGVCTKNTCGDEILGDGEVCDDGNEVDADGCDNDCTYSCVDAEADCAHTVGDCRKEACNAKYVCTQSVDSSDVPDDTNPCTTDACRAGGVPVNDPLDEGSSCPPEGGGDGWCLSNVCTKNKCTDGIKGDAEVCDDGNEVEGDGCDNDCTYSCVTAADDCEHTVGDCHKEICTAQHTCDQQVDGTDIPDDGNHCTNDVCKPGGVPANENLDEGSSCPPTEGGDGWCSRDAVCVKNVCGDAIKGDAEVCDDGNKVEADGCDNDCTWSCVDPETDCGHTPGDCRDEVCTETHTCTQELDEEDVPDDGNHCTNDICDVDGKPQNVVLEDETSCPPGDGGDGWCFTGVCTKNVCGDAVKGDAEVCDDGNKTEEDGCDNDCTYSCADPATDCEHTAGDCRVEVCTDEHTCTQEIDGEDIPEDNNPCTRDTCEGDGTPRVEPLPDETSCPPEGGGDGWCFSLVCTKNICGDGVVGDGESCDDKNEIADDGCENDCTRSCVDAAVDCEQVTGDCLLAICTPEYTCSTEVDKDDTPEDGNPCTYGACSDTGEPSNPFRSDGTPCTTDDVPNGWCQNTAGCVPLTCGDQVLTAEEGCEKEADSSWHDNCDMCAIKTCGDGIVQEPELCDDGKDGDNEDGCTDACRFSCYDDTKPCTGCDVETTDCPDPEQDCKQPAHNCVNVLDEERHITGRACGLIPNDADLPPDGPQCTYPDCDEGEPVYPPVTDLIPCENDPGVGFKAGDDWCIEGKCRDNVCGDAAKGDGEECDDGNTLSFDGCSDKCEQERCGDGITQPGTGEECDDANEVRFDGCEPDCKYSCHEDSDCVCDGIKPNCPYDPADADCQISTCVAMSDGSAQRCRHAQRSVDYVCAMDIGRGWCAVGLCTLNTCGDGKAMPDEEACDDGNDDDSDGCTRTCEPTCTDRKRVAVCGDNPYDCREPACETIEISGLGGPAQTGAICSETGQFSVDDHRPDDPCVTYHCEIRDDQFFHAKTNKKNGTPCSDETRQVLDGHCRRGVCINITCGDDVLDDDESLPVAVREECDHGPQNGTEGGGCTIDCKLECHDELVDVDCEDLDEPKACYSKACLDADPGFGGPGKYCGYVIDKNNAPTPENYPAASNQCKLFTCDDSGNVQETIRPERINTECDRQDIVIYVCDNAGECVTDWCGNGIQGHLETCDDGNTTYNDGCSEVCKEEVCGDGIWQEPLGELCDDGNKVKGDGCEESCRFSCDTNESCVCDDTDETCPYASKHAGCWTSTCARTADQTGKECSHEKKADNTICQNADGPGWCTDGVCVQNTCGDAKLMPSVEQCDDGNSIETDGCTTGCKHSCTQATAREVCTDNNNDCGAPTCEVVEITAEAGPPQKGMRCKADGVVDKDDHRPPSACASYKCEEDEEGTVVEVEHLEEDGAKCADPKNDVDNGVCVKGVCRIDVCGNGVRGPKEQCDDGANGDPSDGCQDECIFSCADDSDCEAEDTLEDCKTYGCVEIELDSGMGKRCKHRTDPGDVPPPEQCKAYRCFDPLPEDEDALPYEVIPAHSDEENIVPCDNDQNEPDDDLCWHGLCVDPGECPACPKECRCTEQGCLCEGPVDLEKKKDSGCAVSAGGGDEGRGAGALAVLLLALVALRRRRRKGVGERERGTCTCTRTWTSTSTSTGTAAAALARAGLLTLALALAVGCTARNGGVPKAPAQAGAPDVMMGDEGPSFQTAHLALNAQFCEECESDADCANNAPCLLAESPSIPDGVEIKYCTQQCIVDGDCPAGSDTVCSGGKCRAGVIEVCSEGDRWLALSCDRTERRHRIEVCSDLPCASVGINVTHCPTKGGLACDLCDEDGDCNCATCICDAWDEYPDQKWCAPTCNRDSDCISRMFCDTLSGRCRPRWTTECESGNAKLIDTCSRSLGPVPGCTEGNPCPCEDVTPAGCQEWTTANPCDCYKGYSCLEDDGRRWCALKCSIDSDCPPGQSCDENLQDGRCKPDVTVSCNDTNDAVVQQNTCGAVLQTVENCEGAEVCSEGRCQIVGACADCDMDADCSDGGRVCRTSTRDPSVQWCVKTCAGDGDCDPNMSCNVAKGHCVPDESLECEGREVVRTDSCDRELGSVESCTNTCVNGACTGAGQECSECTTVANCLNGVDYACANVAGLAGRVCLKRCDDQADCTQGTTCAGLIGDRRCEPDQGVDCSDGGTDVIGLCGNSLEVCAPKSCVDGECKDCTCAQGDCCSDGCTPDPNGVPCTDDPCQVCDGLGQCVPAKDGDNPGGRCPGEQTCRDGQCGSGVCGDGERNAGEACDDGNNVSGDGCSADCSVEEDVCGNRILEGDEECDDGNLESGDGCLPNCKPTCQPTLFGADCPDPGDCAKAACNPLPDNGGATCWTQPDPGKVSDTGNPCTRMQCEGTTPIVVNVDECTPCIPGTGAPGFHHCIDGTCTRNSCGDACPAETEECDDGNQANTDECLIGCLNATCGDGIVNISGGVKEQCDEGNTNADFFIDDDGCTQLCRYNCETNDDCTQTDGDCKIVICDTTTTDGKQFCSEVDDDSDLPEIVPANDCRIGTCTAGVRGFTDRDEGTPCDGPSGGDGWCDGNGVCVDNCCGDGRIGDGEQCDNAVTQLTNSQCFRAGVLTSPNSDDPNQPCRLDCTVRRCGDGITDTDHNERCDDGANGDDDDGCRDNCIPTCSNSAFDCAQAQGDCRKSICLAHQCASQLDMSDRPLKSPCEVGSCEPDGVPRTQPAAPGTRCRTDTVETGWCQTVTATDGSLCDSNEEAGCDPPSVCVPLECGDGMLVDGEGCEKEADDTFHPNCVSCLITTCGDAIRQDPEECDDGKNGDDSDGCTDVCRFSCYDAAFPCEKCPASHKSCADDTGDCRRPGDLCQRIPADAAQPVVGRACLFVNDLNDKPDWTNPCAEPQCEVGADGVAVPNALNVADLTICENDGGAPVIGDHDWCIDGECRDNTCGDGAKGTDNDGAEEECDDGNRIPGDGCSETCQLEYCGDGIVQAPKEQCDDGKLSLLVDGCTNACVFTCQDAQTDCVNLERDGDCKQVACVPADNDDPRAGFVCGTRGDPSDPFVDLDPCTGDTCTGDDNDTVANPVLPDGTVCVNRGGGVREVCVDGRCNESECGDGYADIAGGEACDDGNTIDTDSCDNNCLIAACGNGIVEAGENEQCEGEGAGCQNCRYVCNNPGTDCPDDTPGDCKQPVCVGGGGGQICDLGDDDNDPPAPTDNCSTITCRAGSAVSAAADECKPCPLPVGQVGFFLCVNGTCTENTCGDGCHFVTNEQCDDGNTAFDDGCSPTCRTEVCGDGTTQQSLGEECDDGKDGDALDGCTDQCKYSCSTDAECQCAPGDPRCPYAPKDKGCWLTTCSPNGDGFACAHASSTDNTVCNDGTNDGWCVAGVCTVNTCGDGKALPGEEVCDDGNQDDSDGCTRLCEHTCTEGNVAVVCTDEPFDCGTPTCELFQIAVTEGPNQSGSRCDPNGEPNRFDHRPDEQCRTFSCELLPDGVTLEEAEARKEDGSACELGAGADKRTGFCLGGECQEPLCGNGVLDDQLFLPEAVREECDHGATNGTVGEGCKTDCSYECHDATAEADCAAVLADPPVCKAKGCMAAGPQFDAPGRKCAYVVDVANVPTEGTTPDYNACLEYLCDSSGKPATKVDRARINTQCDDKAGIIYACNELGECTEDWCGNTVTGHAEECDDGSNGVEGDGCEDDCQFSCDGDGDCGSLNKDHDCVRWTCEAVDDEIGKGQRCVRRADPADVPNEEQCKTYVCLDPLPADPNAQAYDVKASHTRADKKIVCDNGLNEPDEDICWYGECLNPGRFFCDHVSDCTCGASNPQCSDEPDNPDCCPYLPENAGCWETACPEVGADQDRSCTDTKLPLNTACTNDNGAGWCDTDNICVENTCGDGRWAESDGEQCDDGNDVDEDGCKDDCTLYCTEGNLAVLCTDVEYDCATPACESFVIDGAGGPEQHGSRCDSDGTPDITDHRPDEQCRTFTCELKEDGINYREVENRSDEGAACEIEVGGQKEIGFCQLGECKPALCGNGVLDDRLDLPENIREECDHGAANGNKGEGCTIDCRFECHKDTAETDCAEILAEPPPCKKKACVAADPEFAATGQMCAYTVDLDNIPDPDDHTPAANTCLKWFCDAVGKPAHSVDRARVNTQCDDKDGVIYACNDVGECVEDYCGNTVTGHNEQCDDGKNGDDTDGCKDTCVFSCQGSSECSSVNKEHDCVRFVCEAVDDEYGKGQRCVAKADPADVPDEEQCRIYECLDPLPADPEKPAYTTAEAHSKPEKVVRCDNGVNEPDDDLCWKGECLNPGRFFCTADVECVCDGSKPLCAEAPDNPDCCPYLPKDATCWDTSCPEVTGDEDRSCTDLKKDLDSGCKNDHGPGWCDADGICIENSCGDGKWQEDDREQCDDANEVEDDGCTTLCEWNCTAETVAEVCTDEPFDCRAPSCDEAPIEPAGQSPAQSGRVCNPKGAPAPEDKQPDKPCITYSCEEGADGGLVEKATNADEGSTCSDPAASITNGYCQAGVCKPSVCGNGVKDNNGADGEPLPAPVKEDCDHGPTNGTLGEGCTKDCKLECTDPETDCDHLDDIPCNEPECREADPRFLYGGRRCAQVADEDDVPTPENHEEAKNKCRVFGCDEAGNVASKADLNMVGKLCDQNDTFDYVCTSEGVCAPDICGNGYAGRGEECDDGNTVTGDGCEPSCEFSCNTDADCTPLNVEGDCKQFLCRPVDDELGKGKRCTAVLDRNDPPTDEQCRKFVCKDELPGNEEVDAYKELIAHSTSSGVVSCDNDRNEPDNDLCIHGECKDPSRFFCNEPKDCLCYGQDPNCPYEPEDASCWDPQCPDVGDGEIRKCVDKMADEDTICIIASVAGAGWCTQGRCIENVCGDGKMMPGYETCDDGNDDEEDGCTSLCQPSCTSINMRNLCPDTPYDCRQPACEPVEIVGADGRKQTELSICNLEGVYDEDDYQPWEPCVQYSCNDGVTDGSNEIRLVKQVLDDGAPCDDLENEIDNGYCQAGECQPRLCGNGILENHLVDPNLPDSVVEECDHGPRNGIKGEGCSLSCKLECHPDTVEEDCADMPIAPACRKKTCAPADPKFAAAAGKYCSYEIDWTNPPTPENYAPAANGCREYTCDPETGFVIESLKPAMINEVCDEREGVTYVCDKNSDCVADWCGNGVVGSLEDCDDGQNHRQNDGCTDACAFSCRRDHDCTKLNNPGDCKRYLCEKVMDEGNRGMKCVPTLDRTDPPADLPCKTYECKVALPDDDTRPAFIVHVAHTRENSVMACSDPAKDLENGICYLGECVAPEVCPDCPESCVCLNGTCLCDEPVGGGLGGCHAGHGGSAGHTHGETPAPSRRRLPGTLLVVLGLTLAIVLRRRAGVLVLAALLASPALLTAAPASAQDTATPAANIDFFQPSPHLSDDIVIATNKTLRHLQASSGAMASWALTTLQIKGPTASRVIVRHRVKTDMTMSLGLFGWTEVGMAVPVVLVNDVIEDRSAHLSPRFAGFGDLVLSGKARLINGCGQFLDKHELGFPMPWQSSLGAQLSLSLPTGDEESLFGSNGLVLRPQVVYAALATDRLSLTANFGAALRTAEDHVLGISIGQEITWGAGISYAVRHGHVYVQSGLRSAIPMDFSRIGSAVSNPYELDIWARWIIKDTIQLFAGAGTGPFRPGYGTPDLRFLAGVGTTFRVTGERLRRDMDRDGIEDTWDRCVCSPKVY